MKAVVAAFNQEKALVGAFSVITKLRMELFQALPHILSQYPNKLVLCSHNMKTRRVAVVPCLVAPVGVGAGVLAGAVAVVQQTLVHIQAGDGAAVAGRALGGWGHYCQLELET